MNSTQILSIGLTTHLAKRTQWRTSSTPRARDCGTRSEPGRLAMFRPGTSWVFTDHRSMTDVAWEEAALDAAAQDHARGRLTLTILVVKI